MLASLSESSCSRIRLPRSRWGFKPTFWWRSHQNTRPMHWTARPRHSWTFGSSFVLIGRSFQTWNKTPSPSLTGLITSTPTVCRLRCSGTTGRTPWWHCPPRWIRPPGCRATPPRPDCAQWCPPGPGDRWTGDTRSLWSDSGALGKATRLK